MLYLSGHVNPELLGLAGTGFMLQPGMGNRIPAGQVWAADTGCYSQGEAFDLENYLRWLRTQDRSACLFATAPDVVYDPVATWKRSAPVLPRLRALGLRAALVSQDGLSDPDWSAFDALFIGGTTGWKLGPQAEALAQEGKRRGKWVHMGRVNSERRLRIAEMWGCDSVDGTFLAFGPDFLLPRLHRWLSRPGLPFREWER